MNEDIAINANKDVLSFNLNLDFIKVNNVTQTNVANNATVCKSYEYIQKL